MRHAILLFQTAAANNTVAHKGRLSGQSISVGQVVGVATHTPTSLQLPTVPLEAAAGPSQAKRIKTEPQTHVSNSTTILTQVSSAGIFWAVFQLIRVVKTTGNLSF